METQGFDIDSSVEGSHQDMEYRPGQRARSVIQLGIMSGALHGGAALYVEPVFFRQGGVSVAMRQPTIQTIARELIASNNDIVFFIETFLDRIQRDRADPDVALLLNAAWQAANAYALPLDTAIGMIAIDFWTRRTAGWLFELSDGSSPL